MSIKIKNLSYLIKNKYILNNINLEIFPGKVLTILGPNGAGKSSLIKLIAGDSNPTKGTILYDKVNLKKNLYLPSVCLGLFVLERFHNCHNQVLRRFPLIYL